MPKETGNRESSQRMGQEGSSRQGNGNPKGKEDNKFWNFVPGTETEPPQIVLYGPISSQQSWWEDRVTPQQFNRELDALGNPPEIVVRINSGGGDVFAANAIFTRLKDHEAKITVKIDGWAASAATIIAMAGDSIKIARNGVFMIHDPAMTVWDTCRAEDLEKMAAQLKVIKQSIVNTYAMKTGKDAGDIAAYMSEEKWWTGDEAVENGFCDGLMFEEASTVIEDGARIVVNSTPIDLTPYKTIPKAILGCPHDAGSPNNIAKNKENTELKESEEKKEEEEMAAESNISTADELKAAFPDLVAAIRNEAAQEERNRIKAIEDMAGGNYADLVSDAKFAHPCTAEQVAVKIVAQQNQMADQWAKDRAKDAEEGNANSVQGAAGEMGADGENPFDAAIDSLKFE